MCIDSLIKFSVENTIIWALLKSLQECLQKSCIVRTNQYQEILLVVMVSNIKTVLEDHDVKLNNTPNPFQTKKGKFKGTV